MACSECVPLVSPLAAFADDPSRVPRMCAFAVGNAKGAGGGRQQMPHLMIMFAAFECPVDPLGGVRVRLREGLCVFLCAVACVWPPVLRACLWRCARCARYVTCGAWPTEE